MGLKRKAIQKRITLILIPLVCSAVFSPSLMVHAYTVGRYLMCSDVDSATKKPIGVGSFFLTNSTSVCFWVNISDVSPGRTLRFDWFDPDNGLYGSWSKDIGRPTVGESWGWYVAWNAIEIKGRYPERVPGTWRVNFYIDSDLEVSINFELIDPESITWKIKVLLDKINEFKTTVYQLTLDYNNLLSNYTTTLIEYNTMTNNYEKLEEEYIMLKENYTSLYNDYYHTKTDYDLAIKAYQSTKTKMYGSLAFALLFFITTIYMTSKYRKIKLKEVSAVSIIQEKKSRKEEVEKVVEDRYKDLMNVKGVGRVSSEKLNTVGIDSVYKLAECDPSELSQKIVVSEKTVSKWIENAKELLSQKER